jgi:hypothetical protein
MTRAAVVSSRLRVFRYDAGEPRKYRARSFRPLEAHPLVREVRSGLGLLTAIHLHDSGVAAQVAATGADQARRGRLTALTGSRPDRTRTTFSIARSRTASNDSIE